VEGVEDQEPARPQTALPPKVESWRRRSATGAVLTGIALGLREVFELEPEKPAIIQEVSGQPVEDLPVEAHVDERRPDESVVTIRPWLLESDPPRQ
jgi:hypothetical protein